MYYGLVYYPDIDITPINRIRKKYDPTFNLIEPHIGVMFPVPDSVGENELISHIESVVKEWKPFSIRISGLTKSWDHWLFLTLEEGNSEVKELYNRIYTGILEKYRRDDLEFIPHIGLGLFAKESKHYDFAEPRQLDFDEQRYLIALKEAESLNLDYRCLIDKLHLLKLTNDFSAIIRSKEFPLGGIDK